jgi:hypothetical protein
VASIFRHDARPSGTTQGPGNKEALQSSKCPQGYYKAKFASAFRTANESKVGLALLMVLSGAVTEKQAS